MESILELPIHAFRSSVQMRQQKIPDSVWRGNTNGCMLCSSVQYGSEGLLSNTQVAWQQGVTLKQIDIGLLGSPFVGVEDIIPLLVEERFCSVSESVSFWIIIDLEKYKKI